MSELLDRPVQTAGGLTVHGAVAVDESAAAPALPKLIADRVARRLADRDPTLWGPQAEGEARIRLGWVDTFRRSRELLPRLAQLRQELAGLDHVVLAGMGGSSLAPEVIARTLGRPLTVLDTTDPQQVRAALGDRLERTVVVVASKSGSTVETESHRRAALQAFLDAGLSPAEAGRRFVIVTDPGSAMSETAAEMGAHLILADPEVGGRFSALTAFGLVPTALAGVDVAELLDQAEALADSLARDTGNPALALGAALGAAAAGGRDKLALIADGTGIEGFGDWAEQLVAESTGKHGRGILPVVVESPGAPGATGEDVLTVTYGGALGPGAVPGGGISPDIAVNGPLGAQFLAWEYATAVAGVVLGIDPFDQPNVTESKENTKRLLASGVAAETPSFTDGAVAGVRPGRRAAGTDGGAASAAGLGRSAGLSGGDGLPRPVRRRRRGRTASAARRRDRPGRSPSAGARGSCTPPGSTTRAVRPTGPSCRSPGRPAADLPVPGQSYSFGELQAAQAAGDRQALTERDRPLVRLHLTDRAAGLAQLREAVEALLSGR